MVTTGELIVGHEKFPQFARCFYGQIGQFSVELLVSWLEDIVLRFLNLSSARKCLEEEIFTGTNFRELVLENRGNFCLMKISRYMVPHLREECDHLYTWAHESDW